jgi:hypothetical protein
MFIVVLSQTESAGVNRRRRLLMFRCSVVFEHSVPRVHCRRRPPAVVER